MTLGLLLTSLTLGLRHGIDWDHIAAIADLTGTAPTRRRGFALSMIYAFGHGAVVFALGATAIVIGASIPDGLDVWMGRIVGFTLIALGTWIIVELLRKGRGFRLQSRWILIINGTFAGLRRVRNGKKNRHVSVDHAHGHEHISTEHISAEHGGTEHGGDEARVDDHEASSAHDHAHLSESIEVRAAASAGGPTPLPDPPAETPQHSHSHSHSLALPDDPSARYGNGTAAGIGMLHGVGVESPTQIALFVASTTVAGTSVGLLLLAGWIVGLIVANGALALLAAFGLLHAEKNFGVYAVLAVFIGVMSIAMGTMFALGIDALPALN